MTTELYALDYHDTLHRGTTAKPNKSEKKQRVSKTEYWEKYYDAPDVIYEWNNGYLEEKAVSDVVTITMYKWLFKLLEHYLTTHPIAQTTLLEMAFTLALQNAFQIRRPDLGIVLNSNPVPLLPFDSSYKGIFDLCVEAISFSTKEDIERDTVSKKLEYAKGGVKEYYILDGHDHYLEFYCLNAQGIYIPIEPTAEGVIQSEVLPGFQFRVGDLFTQPPPDEMINDPIYQEFVLPGYALAKKQAEEEKQARLQAEAEIARLKALLEKLQKAK